MPHRAPGRPLPTPGWLLLAALLALLPPAAALAAGAGGDGAGRGGAATPPSSLPHLQTPAPTGRIVLQFTTAATAADRARVAARAGTTPAPRVGAALLQRTAAKARGTAAALGELARFTTLAPAAADRDALVRLAARLSADPAVETAFLEPRAVPAALGFDAFTGAAPAPARREAPAPATRDTTPDFSAEQGYLAPAPDGIGARAVWPIPGARGQDVAVIDVEGAWLWAHEDLPEPVADLGVHLDDLAWRNHGTAVVAQIAGVDNGLGVEGLVPDAAVGASSIFDAGFPAALLAAAAELQRGDILLIELHAPGPNALEGVSQFGYLPMEFWPDNFAAIRALTDLGIIVVEAAGNGQQDLDDPLYQGLFDRQVRDSGAIMVGATDGSSLWPAWFTNHGSRVDLSGWGEDVVTAGYGDLQEGPETAWYTARFAGTSSASPIVVGAVASLQGVVTAASGLRLDAGLARRILQQTGTPQQGGLIIGPRPDLEAAVALVQQQGVGVIGGTVTDTGTGAPVAGAVVRLVGGGMQITTDTQGRYRLAVLPDSHELAVDSWFHAPATVTVAAGAGETTRDIALAPLPSTEIGGIVRDAAGAPVAGARVALPAAPVDPVTSAADGTFTLPPVPAGRSYLLRAAGVPGHGVAVRTLTVPQASPVAARLVLPAVDHDFEAGPSGFTGDGAVWQRGRPQASGMGPGAAFDGVWCWGVGLGGEGYPNDVEVDLHGPLVAGDQFAGDRLYLGFHYWSGTESRYDGVQVGIAAGGEVTPLTPLTGYSDPSLAGLGGEPGWSGLSGGWQPAVFDLSAWLGQDGWQVVWTFGADEGVSDTGFLIDGVALAVADVAVAAPEPATPGAAPTTLAAWPNPFNPRVNLAWERPAAGPLTVAVYDLRGRLVRRLLARDQAPARGHVLWDGADASGRPAPSGVYLVRLDDPAGPAAVQRITLAR